MKVRPPQDQQPNEPGWWHWWYAADGKWYPPESLPRNVPPAPSPVYRSQPVGSGFAAAALGLGVFLMIAGVIPLMFFIAWAVTPHVPVTP